MKQRHIKGSRSWLWCQGGGTYRGATHSFDATAQSCAASSFSWLASLQRCPRCSASFRASSSLLLVRTARVNAVHAMSISLCSWGSTSSGSLLIVPMASFMLSLNVEGETSRSRDVSISKSLDSSSASRRLTCKDHGIQSSKLFCARRSTHAEARGTANNSLVLMRLPLPFPNFRSTRSEFCWNTSYIQHSISRSFQNALDSLDVTYLLTIYPFITLLLSLLHSLTFSFISCVWMSSASHFWYASSALSL